MAKLKQEERGNSEYYIVRVKLQYHLNKGLLLLPIPFYVLEFV